MITLYGEGLFLFQVDMTFEEFIDFCDFEIVKDSDGSVVYENMPQNQISAPHDWFFIDDDVYEAYLKKRQPEYIVFSYSFPDFKTHLNQKEFRAWIGEIEYDELPEESVFNYMHKKVHLYLGKYLHIDHYRYLICSNQYRAYNAKMASLLTQTVARWSLAEAQVLIPDLDNIVLSYC